MFESFVITRNGISGRLDTPCGMQIPCWSSEFDALTLETLVLGCFTLLTYPGVQS